MSTGLAAKSHAHRGARPHRTTPPPPHTHTHSATPPSHLAVRPPHRQVGLCLVGVAAQAVLLRRVLRVGARQGMVRGSVHKQGTVSMSSMPQLRCLQCTDALQRALSLPGLFPACTPPRAYSALITNHKCNTHTVGGVFSCAL